MRYKITNRLSQALPILLRDKDNPQKFVYSQLLNRGAKIIDEREMSPYVENMKDRGHIFVTALNEQGKLIKAAPKVAPTSAPVATRVPQPPPSITPENPVSKKKKR